MVDRPDAASPGSLEFFFFFLFVLSTYLEGFFSLFIVTLLLSKQRLTDVHATLYVGGTIVPLIVPFQKGCLSWMHRIKSD